MPGSAGKQLGEGDDVPLPRSLSADANTWQTPSFLEPAPQRSDGDAEPEAPCLPRAVLRTIMNYLVQGEAGGSVLLHLLSFCGVCCEWRAVGREVPAGIALGFESMENTYPTQASIQRFRRLSADKRESVFLAAAKLFTGAFALGRGQAAAPGGALTAFIMQLLTCWRRRDGHAAEGQGLSVVVGFQLWMAPPSLPCQQPLYL